MWVRRLFRRAAQVVGGLLLLPVLVLAGFRTGAWFREAEQRQVPPRPGSFLRTPLGELRYQERGGRNGTPVVFIGGTMASSDTFLPLLEALCDERLRCLAIDLPPFGYSERPAGGDYGREQQAARIAAFVRGLGLQGATLVGHSFGAGPTVETAMRYPEDLRGFALLAGALGLGATPSPKAVGFLLAVPPFRTALAAATFANPSVIRLSLRKFVANDSLVTDALVERFTAPTHVRGTAQATGRWAQTALFADESGSRSGQRTNYAGYKAPVLLIWGDKDVATPLAQGQELAKLLPNARLTVIPGVGHFPHVEAQSAVVAALQPFLVQAAAGASP